MMCENIEVIKKKAYNIQPLFKTLLYSTVVMPAESEKFCSSKLTLFMNTVCVALIAGQKNFLQVLTQWAARCHSWYSNLLWAGWSGNQILVRVRFSLLSRLAPRPTQPPVQ
jgi:hypothetical protein